MASPILFPYAALLSTLITFTDATPLRPRATPLLQSQWAALNQTVGGRLFAATPYAKPCYSQYNGQVSLPDATQCSAVQNGWTDETQIAQSFGGYINTNWGACQANATGCGLDFTQPADPTYYVAQTCYQGSVPNYYIDVRQVSDVQAALKFAKDTSVPIVIKNSGHDFKGRSSAPGSLALWTHNYQPSITFTKGFTPEGCSTPAGDAVTLGAGQGFAGVYEFAEANNITVVGGSSRTVGPVGGWISGGGHGAMSNTLGLGVDNVMQIRTVLPNGTYVTANRCQNQDIFYALRGGGGGTFGVNMEMTTRAHPQVTLQVAYIRFVAANTDAINKFIQICTQQGGKWATEGWGGYIAPGALSNSLSGMIFLTPKLSYDEAVASMKPLTDYVASLSNAPLNNEIDTETSFYQAYQKYILPNEEKVGLSLAMGSRLIPTDMLNSATGQNTLATAIQKAATMVVPLNNNTNQPQALTYGPPLQILVTAPSSYQTDGTSSVTPAWYNAAWHVCLGQAFDNNANIATIQKAFQVSHDAAQVLRDITPNSGAYQNEADVFEPNAEQSFWGTANYNKLLALKKQLDPSNILTCWSCIGWDKNDPRYGCYPSITAAGGQSSSSVSVSASVSGSVA